MAHFAKVVDSLVTEIIVAEQDFINTLPDSSSWVQTSYNTLGGVHRLGGTPLRKNFAGVGFTYDNVRDAFIPPKPFESWVLNEETCIWKSTVQYPNDGKVYKWNEEQLNWIEQ
jgi:hypothetical protein